MLKIFNIMERSCQLTVWPVIGGSPALQCPARTASCAVAVEGVRILPRVQLRDGTTEGSIGKLRRTNGMN